MKAPTKKLYTKDDLGERETRHLRMEARLWELLGWTEKMFNTASRKELIEALADVDEKESDQLRALKWKAKSEKEEARAKLGYFKRVFIDNVNFYNSCRAEGSGILSAFFFNPSILSVLLPIIAVTAFGIWIKVKSDGEARTDAFLAEQAANWAIQAKMMPEDHILIGATGRKGEAIPVILMGYLGESETGELFLYEDPSGKQAICVLEFWNHISSDFSSDFKPLTKELLEKQGITLKTKIDPASVY